MDVLGGNVRRRMAAVLATHRGLSMVSRPVPQRRLKSTFRVASAECMGDSFGNVERLNCRRLVRVGAAMGVLISRF